MLNLRKSIPILLLRSFQAPLLKCSFTMYPTRQDRKFFAPEKLPKMEDDLYFPHENEPISNGFQIMLDNLKKRPETYISGRGACLLIYNCGLKEIFEPEIFKLCERDIAINRNSLPARLIFGGLYGSLKTNAASPYMLDFFLEEFKNWYHRKVENEEEMDDDGNPIVNKNLGPPFSNQEFYQLLEACSCNKTLKKEKLVQFILEFIKPAIVAQGKFISYKNAVAVISQLEKLELYDEEIWGIALKKLEQKIRFRNLLYIQSFYDIILRSKNSGKNPIDLTKIVDKLQRKLKSKADYRWRYNVDDNRFYTFEELKAKRDEYNFPDQSLNVKTRYHRERLARYNAVAEVTTDLTAKKRKLTLEKELEQLTFERFMKKKGMESKGEVETMDDFIDDEDLMSAGKKGKKAKVAKEEGGETQEMKEKGLKEGKEEKDKGDIEEEEKKTRKAEKEAERQKFLLQQKKKEKAKLGKGKNKEEMRRMREEGFEKEDKEEN